MKKENMQPMVDFKEIAPLIEKAMEYQNKGYGTVFIRLFGHTEHMAIHLHPYGWVAGTRAEHSIYLPLDTECNEQDVELRIHDIQYIMDTQLTVEQHESILAHNKERAEKEEYERLKEKYG